MKSKGLMNGYRLYKNYWVADEPPYLEKKLSARQAHDILKQGEGLMLRNIYDWDCHEKTSFWFVINDKPMRMENLPSKVRNMVRRALKTLDMHLATKDEMLINQNGGGTMSMSHRTGVIALSPTDPNPNPNGGNGSQTLLLNSGWHA